jgi:hypothetical protein
VLSRKNPYIYEAEKEEKGHISVWKVKGFVGGCREVAGEEQVVFRPLGGDGQESP